MIVKNKNNQIKKSIAINEVSILRQSKTSIINYLLNGKNKLLKI